MLAWKERVCTDAAPQFSATYNFETMSITNQARVL
jgi:hypothetical protein